MLTDPQTVTIDSVAYPMPRISMGNLQSQFATADGGYKLRIAHTVSNRERSVVRLDAAKLGVDPLQSALSKPYSFSVYTVIDRPLNGAGWTDAEMVKILTGFNTYSATAGLWAKILGLES